MAKHFMAHLWRRLDDGWYPEFLAGRRIPLDPLFGVIPSDAAPQEHAHPALLLLRFQGPAAGDSWAVVAPSRCGLRLNGQRLPLGIGVLKDRDQIQAADGLPVYFATEERAEIIPLPVGLPATHCPRCKTGIEPGQPAVRCPNPGCGLWHHEVDTRNCWTYSRGCAVCGHPTDLQSGFQWSPEE